MIPGQVNSLIGLMRSSSALQKTLRVTSFINCVDVKLCEFVDLFIKGVLKNRDGVIFYNNEDDLVDSKKISMINNGTKCMFGKNLFCGDVFKSKYNQEVLKVAGLMCQNELKNLELVLIDATSMFNKFSSKILKISDNILILANTTQDSLDKLQSLISDEKLIGQDVEIVLINQDKKFDWYSYFENFNRTAYFKCSINFEILDVTDKGLFIDRISKLMEKIYLSTIANPGTKNLNFLDFIINILN